VLAPVLVNGIVLVLALVHVLHEHGLQHWHDAKNEDERQHD